MKFLIISRMKDNFVALPIEDQDHIMRGLTAFIEKYRKAGNLKEIYSVPSIKGNVSIWEVDTAERGAALFLENPLTPFQEYEMFVLADFDTSIKVQEGMYEKLLAKR